MGSVEPVALLVSRADLPKAQALYEGYFAGDEIAQEARQDGDEVEPGENPDQTKCCSI